MPNPNSNTAWKADGVIDLVLDLRAPAAAIHGISATLRSRGGELAPDELQSLHSLLYEHTDSLCRLMARLHELSPRARLRVVPPERGTEPPATSA